MSIDADHSRASADRFLRNLGLTFDYALGDAHTSATYHAPGLPFTVLLDREGRVVQRWAGFTGAEQTDWWALFIVALLPPTRAVAPQQITVRSVPEQTAHGQDDRFASGRLLSMTMRDYYTW